LTNTTYWISAIGSNEGMRRIGLDASGGWQHPKTIILLVSSNV
jgi:hypothetical protein